MYFLFFVSCALLWKKTDSKRKKVDLINVDYFSTLKMMLTLIYQCLLFIAKFLR